MSLRARSRGRRNAAFCAILAWMSTARAGAQSAPATPPLQAGRACAGEIVTAVDIRSFPPSSLGGLDNVSPAASQAVRSRFATTRSNVVRAYLRVRVGEVCTELHRSESERLLRAQPFIASASVRAIPDGPGHVRIAVDVVDEFPVVVGGSLRGGAFESVRLGTLNLQGRGLTVVAGGTKGFAYRNGFGIQVAQYGAFGGPNYVAAVAERHPHGEALAFEFAAPFLTPLQRSAYRAGVSELRDYFGVTPPDGPDVALLTRRISYDAAWVTRIGKLDRHHDAGFVGAALLGESVRIGDTATIVSDSGLLPAPNATFGTAYPSLSVVRVAAIAGFRSVHFMPVRGFDALTAQQDVGVGIQLHLIVGPSIWAAEGRTGTFAAGDVYVGMGHESSFASVHILSEVRGDNSAPKWHGMVSSARLSWYGRPARRWTHVVSLDLAAVRHLDFPAQLTFRDADGGIAGFLRDREAGGSRAVARVESRRLIGLFRSRADFAAAAFVDAGRLWAGDVPYGQTTPVRASLGVSLLGAYPSGGKRMYRIDVAYPLNPAPGGSRLEVRVSALDRTRLLWLEPRDVSRVRTGAVPATLTRW